jgi:hypothetical protein
MLGIGMIMGAALIDVSLILFRAYQRSRKTVIRFHQRLW